MEERDNRTDGQIWFDNWIEDMRREDAEEAEYYADK